MWITQIGMQFEFDYVSKERRVKRSWLSLQPPGSNWNWITASPPLLLNQHGGKSRVLSALQTPGISDLRGQSSAQGCLEEPARKPHTYQSSNGFFCCHCKMDHDAGCWQGLQMRSAAVNTKSTLIFMLLPLNKV